MDTDKLKAKESFQNMDNRSKIRHIWEYYSWQIIIGILSLIVVTSSVTQCVMRIDPDVTILLVSQYQWDNVTEIETVLSDYVTDTNNDGKKKVTIMPIVINPDDPGSQALIIKLHLELNSGNTDMVITEERFLSEFDDYRKGIIISDIEAIPADLALFNGIYGDYYTFIVDNLSAEAKSENTRVILSELTNNL